MINYSDIPIQLISLSDTSDRLNLILEEVLELEESLGFIREVVFENFDESRIHFIDNIYNYVKDILLPDVKDTIEELMRYCDELIRFIENKSKMQFRAVKIEKNEKKEELLSKLLFDFILFNEKLYEKIKEILESLQLIINAEAQFVDILPDQMILPPRTHYRRSYQMLEMHNLIRKEYEKAISEIFRNVIFINNFNERKIPIPISKEDFLKNSMVNTHRMISNVYIRNNSLSSFNTFINDDKRKNNYIINSPFWFLASPRYLPILAHEIVHATIPKDLFNFPEYLNPKINYLLTECYNDLKNLILNYVNPEESFYERGPIDIIYEMLSDVIALLTAGPYYIYALFNSYIGNPDSKLEDLIKQSKFNVFTRIDVLLNIIYEIEELNPENIKINKETSLLNILINIDIKEIKYLLKYYKIGLKNNFYFNKDNLFNDSFDYYKLHENFSLILKFYFVKIVNIILSHKNINNYIFYHKKFTIKKGNDSEYFRAMVYAIYLFSAIKRLTLFSTHDDNNEKEITNKDILIKLKTTKFYTLKKEYFEYFIKKEEHYISKNLLQDIPHLVWIVSALQNKIDIFAKEIDLKNLKKCENFNLKYKNKYYKYIYDEFRLLCDSEGIKNNIFPNNILLRSFTEIPFVKVIFHFYKLLLLDTKLCNNIKYKGVKIDKKINIIEILKEENISNEIINNIDKYYNNIYVNACIKIKHHFSEYDKSLFKDINIIHRGLRLFYFSDFNIFNKNDFNSKNNVNIIYVTLKSGTKKINKWIEDFKKKNYIVFGHFDLLQIIEPDENPRRRFQFPEKMKNNDFESKKDIKFYYRNIENEEIFLKTSLSQNEKDRNNSFNDFIGFNSKKTSPFNALSGIRFYRDKNCCLMDFNLLIIYFLNRIKNYNNNNNNNKIGIKRVFKSTSFHDIYVIWEFEKLIHFKNFFSELLNFPGNKNLFINNSLTYLIYDFNNIDESKITELDADVVNKLIYNYNNKKSEINYNYKITFISYGKAKHSINNLKEKFLEIQYPDFIKINQASGRNDIDVKWDFVFDKEIKDEDIFYIYLYYLNKISKQYNIYRFETSFLGKSR